MISCIMPTYNRFPYQRHLVDESVHSFLIQDVDEDTELVIINDCPCQKLELEDPRVRIFNVDHRFDNLCAKIKYAIEVSRGDKLCRWDDDDISLPHRLRYSVKKLGDNLEWRSDNYFWTDRHRSGELVRRPGNTHTMSIWRRDLLEKIGGYPDNMSTGEDQRFNQLLARHGVNETGEDIPAAEIFYIYRWGASPTHLSAAGEDNLGWERIGARNTIPGAYVINPTWYNDYVALVNEWAMAAPT